MKGWIEVHTTRSGSLDRGARMPAEKAGHIRLFQVSNIRWIASCINDDSKGALQTVGDLFIVVTKESYAELRALIERATDGMEPL